MILPSLPQTLIPVVSVVAWFIVNWLKHSTLPARDNALIALLVPLFTALIWAACSGGFTRDLWGDIGLIIVLSYAALALPELETWRQWLQSTLTSPFALWDAEPATGTEPAITTSRGPATPYPTPQALALPSRRLQFADPSPVLHSQQAMTSQNTQPMKSIEEPTPPTEQS